ncbi:MAG: hypothetical protein M1825_002193 [Sarcosagium campestre]|nr:MAG: hypothetical protein M1825_002193 [Sarcosagium campestre]
MTQITTYNTGLDPETVDPTTVPLPAYSVVDASPPPSEAPPAFSPTAGAAAAAPSVAASDSPSYQSAAEEKAALRAQYNGFPDDDGGSRSGSTHPEEQQPVLPTRSQPGHAAMVTLERGLQVPTCSRLVSSGFPYPDVLASYNVSPEDWSRFTGEIRTAAHLNAGDVMLAVTGGAGAFLVGGFFIGWFAAIPAYFTARHVQRRLAERKLIEARRTGTLEGMILRWNEDFFAPRGILIRFDLPGECADMQNMDVQLPSYRWKKHARCSIVSEPPTTAASATAAANAAAAAALETGTSTTMSDRRKARLENKMAKLSAKWEKVEGRFKAKSARKGRIVIMPMNRAQTQTLNPASQLTQSPSSPQQQQQQQQQEKSWSDTKEG